MQVVLIVVPEGIPAAGLAEIKGAEVADGVGAVLAPAHSAALQAVAHHRLAGRFNGAGTDLPTVADVGGIVHAMFVVAEVLHRLAMHFTGCCRERFKVQFLLKNDSRPDPPSDSAIC